MDFDTTVKLNIYVTIAEQARVPGAEGVAQALDAAEHRDRWRIRRFSAGGRLGVRHRRHCARADPVVSRDLP